MHSKNLYTSTDLHKALSERPWFQRTPTFKFIVVPPTISVAYRLELPPIPNVGSDNFLFSSESVGVKDIRDDKKNCDLKDAHKRFLRLTPTGSVISEVIEKHVKKSKTNKVSSTPMVVDNIHDDIISRTTNKCDGR